MFTGLVRAMGSVVSVDAADAGVRLVVRPDAWRWRAEAGDSICVSGCCLTLVTGDRPGAFVFDATPETLAKTTLGSWQAGRRVNLEPSLIAGDPLGGHQVQGHVDGIGRVLAIDQSDGWRVQVGLPAQMGAWLVPKGSICVDGVSLTIAEMGEYEGPWFEVALIPETLERTTLNELSAGDAVNIEADVMVKTIVSTLGRMDLGAFAERARG